MALTVEIRKRLGSFSLEVSFRAEDGETLALLGASGCGKSVTLKCIAGILRPDEGHIELDGRVLYDSAARVDLPPQRRRVGYLFQQYALFPHMTVEQNIGTAVPRRDRRASVVAEKVRAFHLEGLERKRPFQLSGGQQQRVALARILASEPALLLLDEPFSALDSYLKYQLELELADTLAAFPGPSVWVSHDRGEVYRNCRRVCVIDSGRSEPVRTMDELFRNPGTESAARLSGCKNYVSACPGGTGVCVPDWGVEFRCAGAVPPETDLIGIRAHYIRPAGAGEVNALPCVVERVIQDVFETVLLLRPEGARPEAPVLRLAMEKAYLPPEVGSRLTVSIPPEDILLLRKGGR